MERIGPEKKMLMEDRGKMVKKEERGGAWEGVGMI